MQHEAFRTYSEVFLRTYSEVVEFTAGLNDVGELWTTVCQHPNSWKALFCFKPQPVTKVEFEQICHVNLSEEGSNRREAEELTVYSWEVFLQDIQGNSYTSTDQLISTLSFGCAETFIFHLKSVLQ